MTMSEHAIFPGVKCNSSYHLLTLEPVLPMRESNEHFDISTQIFCAFVAYLAAFYVLCINCINYSVTV